MKYFSRFSISSYNCIAVFMSILPFFCVSPLSDNTYFYLLYFLVKPELEGISFIVSSYILPNAVYVCLLIVMLCL